MAKLLSVNVGLPRDISWNGKTVHTGIWKNSVPGRVMVRRLNIDGDGQGDLGGHGGPNRAVMVYQVDSYRYWERELGRNNLSYGQFGENFTVDGLSDAEVCIGDRYRIGTALFEVSQPRVTCYRVGIRMEEPRMPALLVSQHRPGFYFRVLEHGEIGAGDDIVKVADGPERMTVVEVDSLLYLQSRARDQHQLERVLRISSLSPGWQESFQAMLQQKRSGDEAIGNPGLAPSSGPPPAWLGFRALRVSNIEKESASVLSLTLVSSDERPLSAPLPGQFIVLRMHPKPDNSTLLRSYSLSGSPSAERYRISVKLEAGGIASKYLHTQVSVGDLLDVASPRGSFTLKKDESKVILVSAGVGVTPVLAMLHSLAAAGARREIWWLFGARNGAEHPFARESRALLQKLPNVRSYIAYSQPGSLDRQGVDFDASGRIAIDVLKKLGVPFDADFYMCGPSAFLEDMTTGLELAGVRNDQVHTEIFGSGKSLTPGIADTPRVPGHAPDKTAGTGPRVVFSRSGLSVNWDARFATLLDFAEACDVPVRWSCRIGVCHTCESGLVSGSVRYNPEPLEPPANGNLLICCSSPESEVVLDL